MSPGLHPGTCLMNVYMGVRGCHPKWGGKIVSSTLDCGEPQWEGPLSTAEATA